MNTIPLMKHAFLEEEQTKKALAEFILSADRFSMDKMCRRFEQEFSKYQECREAVLFNSGGSANLALLQALKNLGRLKEGDRVGFSALTWSTNVMPILQMGLIPVPVDCCAGTLNVMAENLERRLEETALAAFFATNVLGFAGDLDRIKELCDRQGIIFLEDNCESLGGIVRGKRTGNYGLASTFSFFVSHHMSTIEGGMVCTNDAELADMLRLTRANGWDRNLSAETQQKLREPYEISDFQSKYTFFDLGFNLRPTEITGFLGCTQLNYLEDNILQRNRNHQIFEKCMAGNDDFIHTRRDHIDRVSPFALTIVCKSPELREKYLRRFLEEKIECRPVIAGNMQLQPFYQKYVKERYDLSGTEILHACGFYCGNYPELTESDIERICQCLQKK